MKSAYEIAMEKLKAEVGETRTLTEDEKRRCAEIDNACEAKIAEARLGFDTKVADAADPGVRSILQEDLARELARFEEKREREKEAVWAGQDE
ncbi:MAG: hypothetical protein IID08_09435 [Candidatus Hydrogenedentes bacterium]|nr:hypothetical protein [Candidatus Hydrogenedentota bacterium]